MFLFFLKKHLKSLTSLADKEPSGPFTPSKKKFVIGQKYRETCNIAKRKYY